MKVHARLFLLIGILALCLPALFLACGGEEPSSSTPAVESRPTEAAGTGNGGGGDAGGATPTEASGATGEITAANILGGAGSMDSGRAEGKFASVSAGSDHNCGLRVDGSVACWGNNKFAQAPPPSEKATATEAPRATGEISATAGVGVVGDAGGRVTKGKFASVSAGYDHNCGLRVDGSVACWGNNEFGQATPPEGEFVSVSAGYTYNCGVRVDGSVACWGGNDFGEITPPEGEFASVSSGRGHICGLRADGSVICWGNDRDDGQATPLLSLTVPQELHPPFPSCSSV